MVQRQLEIVRTIRIRVTPHPATAILGDVSPVCHACSMSTAEAALHAGQGRAPIVVEPCGFGLNGGECYSCELERRRQPFPGRSDEEPTTGESERPNPQ